MRRFFASLVVVTAFFGPYAVASAYADGASQSLPTHHLTIETAHGRHSFRVEQALTEKQREIGLMNRTAMAKDRGMIFRFPSSRPVSMWMKNTLIPLDMLFITVDGTIAGIARNAQPLSETIIPSPEPVRFVLELNGGVANAVGIKPGDHVVSPLIGGAGAQ